MHELKKDCQQSSYNRKLQSIAYILFTSSSNYVSGLNSRKFDAISPNLPIISFMHEKETQPISKENF